MKTKSATGNTYLKGHLSRFMGERKMRVADVARATGMHRNTLHRIYKETTTRIDVDSIIRLCAFFECTPGEMFTLEQKA